MPNDTRLVVSASLDIDPATQHIAQAIATATEALRETLRSSPEWAKAQATGGLGMRPLLGLPPLLLIDIVAWPFLLLAGRCLDHAAKLASCTSAEVLLVAISICPPEHLAALRLLYVDKLVAQQTVKSLVPFLQKWHVQDRRLREGAQRGGIKSVLTRTKQNKDLSPDKLRKEREQLIAQGRSTREVAGILAIRYSVHANTIRNKLKLDPTAGTA